LHITFTKLRYKNFLSTGNSFTEIELNKSPTTLVVGKNGSGKSTMLDAISFGAYGKPFRKINKPQLLNSINGKNLVVELEFSTAGSEYMIRRAMRPNVFQIYRNGKLLPQDSLNKDYQEMLETSILKMNHKSFCAIVVLGSANFVPFMQQIPWHRRQIIEDLLDIQVFSAMNLLLRDRTTNNKNAITDVEHKIDIIRSRMDMNNQHVRKIKEDHRADIVVKKERIKKYVEEIRKQNKESKKLEERRHEYQLKQKERDKMMHEGEKIHRAMTDLDSKIDTLKNEIEFYSCSDDCPTCKQAIEPTHKASMVDKKQKVVDKYTAAAADLKKKYDAIVKKADKYADLNNKLFQVSRRLGELGSSNASLKKFIEELKTEIEQTRTKMKDLHSEGNLKKELEGELSQAKVNKENLYEEREVLSIASSLLKDGGIKTKIIKQYIPIINKLINKYLASMDFFIDFTLNEEFEERILSRFRDEFSYASFSEGEKLRIDLALLFAWRAIAKMRNSASTNLLIMDEIFDSSLDANGTEEFMRIVQTLSKDTNVFIISHKTDTISDKFDEVLKFEKTKNFSKMSRAA
jgi:DNA repair exonuclease SbcCD ATPase subunit